MSHRQHLQSPHRAAVVDERARSMRLFQTPSERILWASIRGRALGVQFRRQVPIASRYIGDFVASEVKLVVEVDGGYHARLAHADAARDAKLHRLGWRVLRISSDTVTYNLPTAIAAILAAIGK